MRSLRPQQVYATSPLALCAVLWDAIITNKVKHLGRIDVFEAEEVMRLNMLGPLRVVGSSKYNLTSNVDSLYRLLEIQLALALRHRLHPGAEHRAEKSSDLVLDRLAEKVTLAAMACHVRIASQTVAKKPRYSLKSVLKRPSRLRDALIISSQLEKLRPLIDAVFDNHELTPEDLQRFDAAATPREGWLKFLPGRTEVRADQAPPTRTEGEKLMNRWADRWIRLCREKLAPCDLDANDEVLLTQIEEMLSYNLGYLAVKNYFRAFEMRYQGERDPAKLQDAQTGRRFDILKTAIKKIRTGSSSTNRAALQQLLDFETRMRSVVAGKVPYVPPFIRKRPKKPTLCPSSMAAIAEIDESI